MPKAYCFKCRTTQHLVDGKVVPKANGGNRMAGRCAVCGGALSKLVGPQEKTVG